MVRHLLNFATYLSLLLFAATATLWVRSWYTSDQFAWWTGTGRGQNTYLVSHQNGWLEAYREWPQDFKVVATHGSVMLWTALLPAFRLGAASTIAIRSRRQSAAGHCEVCGYDLRGTPGRCPECGTLPAHGQPAAG